MANDPGGREKLLALGVRNVPVVSKGENYVFGQNLEDVAEFVGLQGTGHTPLPPDQLIRKWVLVLRALQRYAAPDADRAHQRERHRQPPALDPAARATMRSASARRFSNP